VLYGRDRERARIGALLEAARASQSNALVIRGEPGIGKSALLEDTRERATDMHVLTVRGVQSESELPFAALHQLFRPVLGHVDHLPGPQAEALRAALGLAESTGQERFLVFAACLSLLSELAERRPVLCMVDDAQWLDGASADALTFVVRRLDAEGVLMLFGVREGEEATFEAPDVPTLQLEGLDGAAAAQILAHGAGVEAAPAVRELLLEQTAGNALALLEIPSVLTVEQLSGEVPLPPALPLTRQVERVFAERLRLLPPDAQRLLLIAAADDSENAGTITQATAPGEAGTAALNAAERAGLLSVTGWHVTFRHPLVRSAVYGAATSDERRAAHRALAQVFAGDSEQADRRAWHLASAALGPDEAVVAALDEAAERAQARGAYRTAVRALERAAELTSDERRRGRRLVEAARCASVAGADVEAVALAAQAELLVGDPVRRAQLAQVVGLAEIRRGNPRLVPPALLKAAREVADVNAPLALRLLLDAAWAANESGNPSFHIEIGRLAAELAPRASDEGSVFAARVSAGLAGLAEHDVETAASNLGWVIAEGAKMDDPRHVLWAGSSAMWIGDEQQGGVLFAQAAEMARARGAIGMLAPALSYLALQQFVSQRFEQAALAATEAADLAREVGAVNLLPLSLFVLAGVAAIRGNAEEATRHANEAFAIADAHDLPSGGARPVWSLAILDLGQARWAEALDRLQSFPVERLGMVQALVMRTTPDRIEAAVRAGRPDAAEAALSTFEAWAAHVPTSFGWVRACLAWGRALLADGDAATPYFEEALRYGADGRPFDFARIRLLYGEHLRRMRRRTESRVQLRAALEAFERYGAEPWAERARSELRASGETARRRDPSTTAQLTPQELQIARYVAEGLSNKEVAAQLFLSPRTIDSHLRSVFSKLAITSRTQLARLPLGDELATAAA
jgi:DNA-binding CsgD family transcriptional regulator